MNRLFKIMVVTLFAAVLTVSAADKSIEHRLVKAKINLMQALKSDNEGVRNGSLLVLAKIKSEYPGMDFSDLNRTLKRLSTEDSQAYIRANANLTFIYLNSTELPETIKVENIENPAIFFNKLFQELNKHSLALR